MEQYITFETAKTCKELGLDLPHTHYYVYPFRPAFKATGELMKNAVPDDYHNTMLQVVRTRKNQPQIAPAYTQSVLQKYLRDTYSIDVAPYPHYTNLWRYTIVKFNFTYHDNHFKVDISKDWSGIKLETYEDALDLGLQEGIKLIPAKKIKTEGK